MNSHKQWIRDPEHPTIWILNPNFRPSDPPSMQIQPIEDPIIQLPVEVPPVKLPQVQPPPMQIQPIAEPIIQLPVEVPHVKLPQVEPPAMQLQPIVEPIIQLPVEVPKVAQPPTMQIQPIVEPIQLPGLIVDSHGPPTALFHPGFQCLGPANCPHFSHQTQTPPQGVPSNNIIFLPVTLN